MNGQDVGIRENVPLIAPAVRNVNARAFGEGLDAKGAPIPRPIVAPADGRVVAVPQVGGLHHRYDRQAA